MLALALKLTLAATLAPLGAPVAFGLATLAALGLWGVLLAATHRVTARRAP